MIIHVVQPGETIQSISDLYGVPEDVLVQDNGLDYPQNLVVGQCIVITYPELTYMVKEGDTLISIAESHNVTLMQLLQNNPFLADRQYIYPGERLIIIFDKIGTIATHGFALPYISQRTLRMTLPYLTYISVANYTVSDDGNLISYYDDTELIQTAKEYNTIPLMFITTLTLKGEANIGTAYELLTNEEKLNILVENILSVLREKGYYGINLSFEFISDVNLPYIEKAYSRIANLLKEEGFMFFGTINPNIEQIGSEIEFIRVDYTYLGQISDSVLFMSYEFALNLNPPSPISSIYNLEIYLNYVKNFIPSSKVSIGLATIGYDWELPFFAGISSVHSLTYDSAVNLARNQNVPILFDEESQTPFFLYTINDGDFPTEHIVWFIDARSINALLGLMTEFNLYGVGIWNITVYNPQLWLIINSQFEIEKFDVQ